MSVSHSPALIRHERDPFSILAIENPPAMMIRCFTYATTVSALMTLVVCMPQSSSPQQYYQENSGRLRARELAHNFEGYFGVDEAEKVEIGQRIDNTGDEEDEPICQSIKRILFPKRAKNKENKWVNIMNHGEYKQGITVEQCTSDSEYPCEYSTLFPNGHHAICVQKMVMRKLVAINDKNQTYTDTFSLPGYCSCVIRKKFASSRFNMPNFKPK
ncbi:protein spaetzle-like [Arctopsyche grandis]|uniref:protein spaetzle-like n=1 Tax=Arctopsyche grandis TaxID=121162 RepID=UPI00406DA0C6